MKIVKMTEDDKQILASFIAEVSSNCTNEQLLGILIGVVRTYEIETVVDRVDSEYYKREIEELSKAILGRMCNQGDSTEQNIV